jgi:ABC-type lipopolysaccharide export system ATPase subunit
MFAKRFPSAAERTSAEGDPGVVANLEIVRQVYLGENFAY